MSLQTRPVLPKSGPQRRWGRLTLREKLLSVVTALILTLGIAQIVNAQRDNRSDAVARFMPLQGLPFERAGENFPGSAFYYLDDDSDLQGTANLLASTDGLEATLGAMTPGGRAIAPSLFARGSATDKARALQCLTAAIYYEAATEPDAGQQAVAQVVLNRLMHPSYPDTVCGVVYQGSERQTGCQFSFSCDGSMARSPSTFYWSRAKAVAQKALSGHVYAPVGLATHYHTTEVSPYWAPSLAFLGTIGAHRFYSWKGSAGFKSAFYKSYRGLEPYPGPKPRRNIPASGSDLDPVRLAQAYEKAMAQTQNDAVVYLAANERRNAFSIHNVGAAVPSGGTRAQAIIDARPVYSAEAQQYGGETAYGGGNLPGTTQIRPEYRESGKWIASPAD